MEQQDDLFDFLAELDKPIIDDDIINRRAINRLLKIIENPYSKDSDANNAAKLLLTYTKALTEKIEVSSQAMPVKVEIIGKSTNRNT